MGGAKKDADKHPDVRISKRSVQQRDLGDQLGINSPRVIQKYTKFNKTIFSLFYNISQPNFAVILNIGCSSKRW